MGTVRAGKAARPPEIAMPLERVGDIDIHYEIHGRGPPLVFLPGLGLDLGIWNEVAGLLGGVHTCLLVDSRGAGSSAAPPGPYTVRGMAADLHGLLPAVGIECATLVGHSLGGFVALQFALDYPRALGGLILLSTAPSGDPARLGTSPEVRAALERTRGPLAEILRGNVSVAVSDGFAAGQPARFEEFLSARLARAPRGRGLAGQRAAAAAFDAGERLGEVRPKAAVIHGLEDRVIPVERARELAGALRDARLVELEGVGHLPMLEAPDRLARLIAELILS